MIRRRHPEIVVADPQVAARPCRRDDGVAGLVREAAVSRSAVDELFLRWVVCSFQDLDDLEGENFRDFMKKVKSLLD